MKRIVFLLILLLLLPSCGQQRRLPTFETFPMTLSGTLAYNGESIALTAVFKNLDSCDIGIDSPENLSGYSFKVDNSSVWVYYDDMRIELKQGSIDIPFSVLPEMLSVSREDFEYSRTDSENTIYYYTRNSADTVIYIKKSEELPCRIEYKKDGTALAFDIETLTVQ
ncbi:MAG: hypothetical protein IJB24_01590 [Clostridia bacterium]|nr:hypothetical protein [Clostridia bacterium]